MQSDRSQPTDRIPIPDATTEDLWIASLMGPAHLFPIGRSEAICGHPWVAQAWNAERERPALALCCSKCVDATISAQEKDRAGR